MKPKECPKCKSEKVLPMAYGLFGPDNAPKDAYLPGCVIEEDSPKWHCDKCGHEWGKAGND